MTLISLFGSFFARASDLYQGDKVRCLFEKDLTACKRIEAWAGTNEDYYLYAQIACDELKDSKTCFDLASRYDLDQKWEPALYFSMAGCALGSGASCLNVLQVYRDEGNASDPQKREQLLALSENFVEEKCKTNPIDYCSRMTAQLASMKQAKPTLSCQLQLVTFEGAENLVRQLSTNLDNVVNANECQAKCRDALKVVKPEPEVSYFRGLCLFQGKQALSKTWVHVTPIDPKCLSGSQGLGEAGVKFFRSCYCLNQKFDALNDPLMDQGFFAQAGVQKERAYRGERWAQCVARLRPLDPKAEPATCEQRWQNAQQTMAKFTLESSVGKDMGKSLCKAASGMVPVLVPVQRGAK